VPQAQLDDLARRLEQTRWPDEPSRVGWSHGIPVGYLRELAEYWRAGYDWRAQEARLNRFPQFTTDLDGHPVHFVNVRSPEPAALPLVLTHGWPGSIVEFLELIGPLTDPRAHGGDPADAFHVVVPSPPGFGLSGPTRETGWTVARVARAWAELMDRLGDDRYVAHGGDFGALTSRALGLAQPERVAAVHVTQVFDASATAETADFSVEAEKRSVEAGYRYEYELGGYAAIQSTRPQLIAYGLTDSPVFQLAWIADGFKQWTDSTDVPEDAVDRDAMLTNVMLYWLTGTTTSCAGPSSTAAATSPPWRSPVCSSATCARPSVTTASHDDRRRPCGGQYPWSVFQAAAAASHRSRASGPVTSSTPAGRGGPG
jgi:pimeloyl-ACP methyl ester carboxylesterase